MKRISLVALAVFLILSTVTGVQSVYAGSGGCSGGGHGEKSYSGESYSGDSGEKSDSGDIE